MPLAQLPAIGEEVPETLAPRASAPPPFRLPAIGEEVPQGAAAPAMNFAIVNGRRVPIDEDTGEPAPPASTWEKLNTSPIHHEIEAARRAISDYISRPSLAETRLDEIVPRLHLGTGLAMGRGAIAGMTEGALNVAESYTTPVGATLALTGLTPASKIVKLVPALEPLLSLPAVQALRNTVHGVAGAAFATHGAGTMAEGGKRIFDAADPRATPPPEGRITQALQGAQQFAHGAFEFAGGYVGAHQATAGPRAAYDSYRRTAAGAATFADVKKTAPPSVSAPYTDAELHRALPELIDEHHTTGPIGTVAEARDAADRKIAYYEHGINATIATNPHELITTRPLDAVRARLGRSPSGGPPVNDTDLAKGLKTLAPYGLDQPLTVQRANEIRQRFNAEVADKLRQNGYDRAEARKVDPAFAAMEAAADVLRDGIADVLDNRVGVGGFTRDTRAQQGALIAVRNALQRQIFQSQATVGGTGTTSTGRKIAAGVVKATGTAAGGVAGGMLGGPWPAGAGALIGGGLALPIAAAIDQPPLTRDQLVARAFGKTRPSTGLTAPNVQPVGPGGPGGPGGPSAGPGLPPSTPPAGSSPRQIAVGTFLALRARGFSRTQAIQIATSYARRGLGPGPEPPPFTEGEIIPPSDLPPGPPPPRGLPPAPPPPPVTREMHMTDDALRWAADNGIPAYSAAAKAELARRATLAPDAAPAVAPQPAPAPRAGIVTPDRGPELPAAAGERVQPTPERPARPGERRQARAAERAATRADADAQEHQALADLVTQAQANGYTGDPAALHAELVDRLEGIKQLHAEFDDSGRNGLVLLRAIADAGGISIHNESAQKGEIARLKEFRDTAPSQRKNAGNLAKRRPLDTVRGVRGVFRDTRARAGGIAEGSLDHILEALHGDDFGRFSHLKTINDLVAAVAEAARGTTETQNALKDLAATSHDLIGTATIHPEDLPDDDLSFDPAALEAEHQAAAAPAPAITPTAPANLDEYLSSRKYAARLRAQYFTDDNKQIASSRETPQTAPIPKLGTWRIDDGPRSLDGREIAQLREVPIDQIEISEDTGPGKFADVEQYARWIQEGKTPPPIDILQTHGGTLKTLDHRRLLAAKAAGQTTIQAWVSPSTTSDRPGAPTVGLTYELAQKGAVPIAEKPARPEDTIFKDDAKRLEDLRARLAPAPVADVTDRGDVQPPAPTAAPATMAAPMAAPTKPYTKEVLHVTTPEGAAGIRAQGFDVHRGQGLGGDHYGPGIYLADYQRDMGSFWREQLATKNESGTVETDALKGQVSLDRPFHYDYNKVNRAGDVIGRISPRDALAAQRPDLLPAYDVAVKKPGASERTALGAVLRGADYDGLVIEHHAGDEIIAFDPKAVTWDAPKTPLTKGQTYWAGDKAAYTGKSETVGGELLHQIRLLEGPNKGELRLTPRGPETKTNVK